MNGEILVVVLLGVMILVALLGSLGRVDWRRAWNNTFADAWLVQATMRLFAFSTRAVVLLRLMKAWWRDKVYLRPEESWQRFSNSQSSGNVAEFLWRLASLIPRISLWLFVNFFLIAWRQIGKELSVVKSGYVRWAKTLRPS